jgi:hypothetical protein
MNNVMLDLETWGTSPGAAIRSIGAVMFDPISGEMGADFYTNVDDASCLKAGLMMDGSTVDWWSKQSQQARDSLLTDQVSIKDALLSFNKWVRDNRGMFVWSQGANFDEPIITAAMRAVNVPVPWKFWDVRDTRTAYDMARFSARSVKRTGTYHNALDDAHHQARCVILAYGKLYSGRAA